MRRFALRLLLALAAVGPLGPALAVVRPVNNRPDFVRAYLLMIDPGGELYSCAGHAALRLVCADEQLDRIFSYESEPVRERVLTFLAGRLKMGMAAWPAEECLALYRRDGRGIRQYELNLPIDVKCRLWKVMDDKVAEGMCLPYDYLERGCAQTTLRFLMEAVSPYELVIGGWPEKLKGTQRQIFCDYLKDFPWNRFFAQTIVGVNADYQLSPYRKVVIPEDLLNLLRQAKVAGQPVITGDGEQIVAGQPIESASWFTPLVAASLYLVLVLVGVIFRIKVINWLAFGVYALIAALYTYLVGFSSLPATEWHWLAVPFNLFPLVAWRWRRYWALPFAGLLGAWLIGVLLWPHLLVDPAWLLIVAAYVVYFAKVKGEG